MHGDEHSYPIVSVEINLQGQTHIIKAEVSTRLSHPLILGTDWPGFQQIVKDLTGVRSRQLGRCEVCTVDSGDAGSSDTAERGPGVVGLPAEALWVPDFPPMEDFPLDQSRDDTLRFAFDQGRSVDGHLVRPDTAPSHLFFSIMRDRLYRVCRDIQAGEEVTQMLFPKSRREMVFQAAHYNPMVGHLGSDKTQKRIMD